MIESSPGFAPLLFVIGIVTLTGIVLRGTLERVGLPAMAGYILIGVGLAALDGWIPFLAEPVRHNLDFLAKLGVVVLLFRVGLESDLGMLAAQLRNAAAIWLPSILVAGLFGFAVVYFWPGLGLVPALFVGVAASATSIGVSAAMWEDAGRLKTDEGALLLDIAELDDVSAVILLSMLFAVVPIIQQADNGTLWTAAGWAALTQSAKLAVFCLGCYLFSRRLEAPLSAWFNRLDHRVGPLILAAGITFLIAAAADLLGFSIAIGALFAGLAFSRDPEEQEIDRSFTVLYAVFAPFFFVAIGLSVQIGAFGDWIWLAAVLLAAAIAGKVLGTLMPALFFVPPRDGLLIGLSMTPRAEIFLIVMLHGLTLGDWAVPDRLYTAAVVVSLATCILGPVAVKWLLSNGGTASERAGKT